MHGLPTLPPLPFLPAPTERQTAPPSAWPALALPAKAPSLPSAAVTCFLLPLGREQIPVWVFVPAALAHGTPALVVRLGEQGLQVFTPPGAAWGTGRLRLHLLEQADGSHAPHPDSVRVQRLWRRTVSHSGDLHGLALLEAGGPAATALRRRSPEPLARNWMRAVIEADPA